MTFLERNTSFRSGCKFTAFALDEPGRLLPFEPEFGIDKFRVSSTPKIQQACCGESCLESTMSIKLTLMDALHECIWPLVSNFF